VTLFERIVRREIPADIVWEDADVLAFRDVNPQAPVHVLIVPKRVIQRLADATSADEALLGKLLLASRAVAEKLDLLASGYRVVINSGPDAGESVPHLHLHVLGKRALAWPPG
jgi:histidine triad (HIT) family protein